MERAGEDSGIIKTGTSESISLLATSSRTFFSECIVSPERVFSDHPVCPRLSKAKAWNVLVLGFAISVRRPGAENKEVGKV
jgi:hypothetical protein